MKLTTLALLGLALPHLALAEMNVSSTPYGSIPGAGDVTQWTLSNGENTTIKLIDFGATITHIEIPDKNGIPGDIVLGFDTIEGYTSEQNPYFGCTLGRYANRIANAQFSLEGQTYTLAANNGQHSLHGGMRGFDKHIWQGRPLKTGQGVGVIFTRTSPDGEEGFPGNLEASVTYTLQDDRSLRVDYTAKTDKPTVISLSNHSYFNLEGHNTEGEIGAGPGTVLDHLLSIQAKKLTATDPQAIPTGQFIDTSGTPFDFRMSKSVGRDIQAKHPLLTQSSGYDHNFVLSGTPGVLRAVAKLRAPQSGRTLEVMTTEPGLQLYTANHLSGVKGKYGCTYNKRDALCLETQKFPDSPNRPEFPTATLKPGKTWRSTTVFKFGAK